MNNTNNEIKELTNFLDKFDVEYKVVGNRVEADKVDLAFESITHLPESIGNLKCKELYLESNDLTSLPDSFGKLKCEKLHLYNNRLTSLPKSFRNLKCKYLNFSFNQLTSESRHLLDKLKSNGVKVVH